MVKNLRKDLTQIEAVLAAVLTAWSIVAANLTQIGAPVKVVSAAGAALAVVSLVLGKAISSSPPPAA